MGELPTRRPILLAVLALAALLACGSKRKTCRGVITYEGKTFNATGFGKEEAKSSACLGWCSEHDRALDAMHRAWKATPQGSRSKDTKFGEFYSMPNGRNALHSCKARCLAAASTGKATIAVTCP